MTRMLLSVFSLILAVVAGSRQGEVKPHEEAYGALRGHTQKRKLKTSATKETIDSRPMYMYKDDCWKKRPVVFTQLAQRVYKINATLPGAGMEPEAIEPFVSVLKDGFSEVACIKDYMVEHGDAFGANKHSYKLKDFSNVSIVHYNALVPKEDREPMTHAVCFDFCRTVPDMLFFGITAGRDCYCEPFYKMMAGDSSQCDAVCEGDSTTSCGGMAKSSIFEMHLCADTAEDLAGAMDKANELAGTIKKLSGQTLEEAENMQAVASNLQTAFGKAGDGVASDLCQQAKVTAGDLQHSAEDSQKIGAQLAELISQGEELEGANFQAADEVKKAEEVISALNKALAEGEASMDGTLDIAADVEGEEMTEEDFDDDKMEKEEKTGVKKTFMPLMYFVDREFEDVPSTCGGDVYQKIGLMTKAECMKVCLEAGKACAGLSFLKDPDHEDEGLCAMMSKFKSVTYYTECGDASKLAKRTRCYAKFESFNGVSLKPDPSGKSKFALKTADKAQRCFA